MKPIDVKNNKRFYIDENNEKDSRFKVGGRVRISKFKNIFAKGLLLIGALKYLLLIK